MKYFIENKMKKMNSLYCLILALLLFSCNENNPVEQDVPLVVSETEVALSPKKPYVEISIVKGAGNYIAASSVDSVAQSLLLDNKLIITGYKIGKSTITLTDKDKNQVTIKVTINEFIPRVIPLSNVVFVKIGDSKYITNTDPNPIYFLMDTASVIQVGGTATNVQITAKKKGTATLNYLKEYWPTLTYNIQVIDHYLFTVTPSTNTLRHAVGTVSEYYILSGCGDYGLSNSNQNVISTELLAWPILTTLSHNNPRIVRIKGLQKGTSELKITNVETAEVKTVNVTVG
jgi:hypothetical protein